MGWFRDLKDDLEDVFYDLKHEPLRGIGALIPKIMVMISVVGFVVAYVKFIMSGTYPEQYYTMLSGEVFEAVTMGTIPMMYHKVIVIPIVVLFLIQLVMVLLSFFVYGGGKGKRRVFASLIVVLLSAVGYGILTLVHKNLSEWVVGLLVKILAVIVFIALLVAVISILVEETSQVLKAGINALLLCGVVLPLILAALENIIPLFWIILIGGVLLFFLWIFVFGGSEGGSSSKSYSESSYRAKEPEPVAEKKEEKPVQGKVLQYPASCQVFYHEETFGGALVYVCDYGSLLAKDGKPELKTKIPYADFKSGKIIIEVGYKRVTDAKLIRNYFPYK